MPPPNNMLKVGGIEISEASSAQPLQNFAINTGEYKLALFRTLLGTSNIEHPLTAKKSQFKDINSKKRINCFTVPFDRDNSVRTNTRIKEFSSAYLGEEYPIEKFGEYFKDTCNRNTDFYKRLLTEIAYGILYREKEPITAFVHLYRAIEVICFALPMLVYTAKNTDYIGGFTALQNLLSGNEKSEMPFFKKYLELLVKQDQEKSEYSFEIIVTSNDTDNARRIKTKLKTLCNSEKITLQERSDASVPDATSPDLSFGMVEFYQFICALRNRFFHYSTGNRGDNFSFSDGIVNPLDIFYSANDVILNWLAIIFSDILIEELKSYSGSN